jgi:hypothetical protein
VFASYGYVIKMFQKSEKFLDQTFDNQLLEKGFYSMESERKINSVKMEQFHV